jgi:uncharacterized protein YkwD
MVAEERLTALGAFGSRGAMVAALALGVVLGAPSLAAARASPGVVNKDTFTITAPGVATYGPNPALTCPSGGPAPIAEDEVARVARKSGKKAAVLDGRLCAAAETLVGWSRPEPVPQVVSRAVAWHFGLATPFEHVLIQTIDTEDSTKIGLATVDAVSRFAENGTHPRFGLATTRLRRDSTRIALVLYDAEVEFGEVPRQLPAGGKATLTGTLPEGLTHVHAFVGGPAGDLHSYEPKGTSLEVELTCGEKPGLILAEVRGEEDGLSRSVASFPLACGVEPPNAVAIPPAPVKGKVDTAAAEKRLFDLINAERQKASLPPLALDPAVEAVARSVADDYLKQAQGQAPSFNLDEALKKAGVGTLLVLQNPMAAPSVEDIHALVMMNATNRSNLLSSQVTHAGVGMVQTVVANGFTLLYASELFVREQAKVDTKEVQQELYAAIAKRREAGRSAALVKDPLLEEVAEGLAQELAASGGTPPKARESAIVAPLYKPFRVVNIMSGVKSDPLEFAEESAIAGEAQAVGVGVAQGDNPNFGKNSIYVVAIVGSRK